MLPVPCGLSTISLISYTAYCPVILYDKSRPLTLILLTWRIWRAPDNASKWKMEFNSEFKVLSLYCKCIGEAPTLVLPLCIVVAVPDDDPSYRPP